MTVYFCLLLTFEMIQIVTQFFLQKLSFVCLTDKQKLFKAPETASSVMDALQQRMTKYKDAEEQAKQEGSTSKMKRMGRIVKVKN